MGVRLGGFNVGVSGAQATGLLDKMGGRPTEFSLPKAIAGAFAGAFAVGIIYGLVGAFFAEFKFLAIATGAASGFAAQYLGGGQKPVVGAIAAGATLLAMLFGKLIVGDGGGMFHLENWVAYHTTLFDILFCWLGAPAVAAAFGALGDPQKIMNIVNHIR